MAVMPEQIVWCKRVFGPSGDRSLRQILTKAPQIVVGIGHHALAVTPFDHVAAIKPSLKCG
jgi:hypothetical protein